MPIPILCHDATVGERDQGADTARQSRILPDPRGSVRRVMNRRCSKAGCSAAAVATLTYAYHDSTAVVGPLALRDEPGTHDLCRAHSERLVIPRGWELIRLPLDPERPGPSTDDLLALADAVREVGFAWDEPHPVHAEPAVSRRKGHLAVVADPGGRPR